MLWIATRKLGLSGHVERDFEEIGQSEWFGKPLTATFFEKPFSFGSCHVSRDKDHPSGQRWFSFGDRAIKGRAVHSWHLEIADEQVVHALLDPVQCGVPVPGLVNLKPGVGQCL